MNFATCTRDLVFGNWDCRARLYLVSLELMRSVCNTQPNSLTCPYLSESLCRERAIVVPFPSRKKHPKPRKSDRPATDHRPLEHLLHQPRSHSFHFSLLSTARLLLQGPMD